MACALARLCSRGEHGCRLRWQLTDVRVRRHFDGHHLLGGKVLDRKCSIGSIDCCDGSSQMQEGTTNDNLCLDGRAVLGLSPEDTHLIAWMDLGQRAGLCILKLHRATSVPAKLGCARCLDGDLLRAN